MTEFFEPCNAPDWARFIKLRYTKTYAPVVDKRPKWWPCAACDRRHRIHYTEVGGIPIVACPKAKKNELKLVRSR